MSEPQIFRLTPASVGASTWHGIRVTLGCGHMRLEDKPEPGGEREGLRVIGALTACYTCPKRRRFGGAPGTAAVRQIVNVEDVTGPREPEHLGSEHWYWESGGE